MVDKRKSLRKFDDDFKKSIVKLYENGKSQNSLAKEYGLHQLVLPLIDNTTINLSIVS
jgi:transposase-like protein